MCVYVINSSTSNGYSMWSTDTNIHDCNLVIRRHVILETKSLLISLVILQIPLRHLWQILHWWRSLRYHHQLSASQIVTTHLFGNCCVGFNLSDCQYFTFRITYMHADRTLLDIYHDLLWWIWMSHVTPSNPGKPLIYPSPLHQLIVREIKDWIIHQRPDVDPVCCQCLSL